MKIRRLIDLEDIDTNGLLTTFRHAWYSDSENEELYKSFVVDVTNATKCIAQNAFEAGLEMGRKERSW